MKSDICLLFMPQCMPYDPYPSLPYLTGYLRERQVTVHQYDANIEYYHYVLTPERLKLAYKQAWPVFEEFNRKDTMTDEEAAQYRAFAKPLLFAGHTIASITAAIQVMQDKNRFYDPEQYLWASNIISAALALYSAGFYPEKINQADYQFYREVKSVQDILELVESGRKSVFDDFLLEVLLPYIEEKRPAVIGLSMFDFSQFYVSLLFARLVRMHCSYTPKIIFGGIFINFHQKRFVKYPELFDYIDGALLYEGEAPLYQYMEFMNGRRELHEVNNLVYRGPENKTVMNGITAFDIHSITMPDYDGLPLHKYLSPEVVMSVIASKGCSWGHCTFCTQHLISGRDVYVESKIGRLISDIKRLQDKYGTRFFWINDTSVDADRMGQIADLLLQEKIDIAWRCETRFDKALSDEIIVKLAAAGCKKIGFGMESASPRIIKSIRKGITLKNVTRILKTCHENKIAPQVYYIIGFPTETQEDVDMTLRFIEEHRQYMGSFGFSELYLEEESELQLYPEKYGITQILLSDELRREYSFESSGIGSETARRIVRETVDRYSTEIGSKPFWGDEVESHHLFYLNHYNDPQLLEGMIRPAPAELPYNAVLQADCQFGELNFSLNELGDKPAACKPSRIVMVNRTYRIFQMAEPVVSIIKEFLTPRSLEEIAASLPSKYDMKQDMLNSIIRRLLSSGILACAPPERI